MRIGFLALLTLAGGAMAQAPTVNAKPVGTMAQLMVDVIFPVSNAVFYVRDGPKNEKEWIDLETYSLMLGEAANLLMAPERARDKEQWMADAKLLWEVGNTAYKATKKRDVAALQALNDPLYEACQSCHVHYRKGYVRKP